MDDWEHVEQIQSINEITNKTNVKEIFENENDEESEESEESEEMYVNAILESSIPPNTYHKHYLLPCNIKLIDLLQLIPPSSYGSFICHIIKFFLLRNSIRLSLLLFMLKHHRILYNVGFSSFYLFRNLLLPWQINSIQIITKKFACLPI